MSEVLKSSLSRRPLSTFKISNEILTKLKSKGFTLKSEIQILSDSKLQSICDFNESQLQEINEVIRNSHKDLPKIKSLGELLASVCPPIHTGSYSLDRTMNGGVRVGKVTQISAEGGAGKTQICMQCCVNVQLPPKYGGLSGQALYVDTENNLRPERIVSMAKNRLSKHPDLMPCLSPDIIKSRVHVFHSTTNSTDFIDCIVNRIEPFIDQNPEIRLVVIDSIAQHFRFDYRGTDAQKDYELALIANSLKKIAHFKKVAVLIANQVTFNTKLRETVPALGKYWQSNCNISVMFAKYDYPQLGYRMGELCRTNETEIERRFYFGITEDGIGELLQIGEGDWHPNY